MYSARETYEVSSAGPSTHASVSDYYGAVISPVRPQAWLFSLRASDLKRSNREREPKEYKNRPVDYRLESARNYVTGRKSAATLLNLPASIIANPHAQVLTLHHVACTVACER